VNHLNTERKSVLQEWINQPTALATIGGQITARQCLSALRAYRRRLDKRAGHA